MVSVYEFTCAGVVTGCGTKVEFDYWTSQGVFPEGSAIGREIASENASEDAARKQAWGIA